MPRVCVKLPDAAKDQLWAAWKAGVSLGQVSRALNREMSSLYSVIKVNGGIAPRPRRRAARTLTLTEREEISRGMASGLSIRAIARRLGRAPSTVSREIHRNGERHYRAAQADSNAWSRARRPKSCLFALNETLRQTVAVKLEQNWSPEQIAGWLKTEFADDQRMRVSAETIYRSLFLQTRGVLKRELVKHLRSRRSLRRARGSLGRGNRAPRFPDSVMIRTRPAEVEDRAVPGHWEGDLLFGTINSHIATLVERQTRFTMLVKLHSRETGNVVKALSRKMRKLPTELRRSLTWDQGKEITDHAKFTIATDIKVFICDPHSPWQRGTNENTNGLLRQYFPRGTDLSRFTQADLDRVARQLNQRPRKTLGFASPAQKLQVVLQ